MPHRVAPPSLPRQGRELGGEGIVSLLDYLAADRPDEHEWRGWRVARVGGGMNNLLFRATRGERDLAIKWTIRDERDRAGREYAALAALREAGLEIAPAPLLIERDRYPQPVVVQSWLAGEVAAAPPRDGAEWERFLQHHLAIHSLAPGHVALPIRPAVLNMSSAAEGVALVRLEIARLPEVSRPAELRDLARRLDRAALPDWSALAPTLCRVDPNILNFVRQPGAWASVDWENSGWGDPAFEIADTIAHPSYAGVPPDRWGWLVDVYCARRGDSCAAERIRVYHALMLFWWVARFARLLYEAPRGGDRRLAARPDGWLDDTRAKYDRYLALAQAARI